MDVPWDHVTCSLSARRDIASETVRVDVKATVALSGEDAEQFRDIVRKALVSVLDAKWDFESIKRREDGSGIEQMHLIATTRVLERLTSGLTDRVRKGSRPGLKLELQEIHYRPPRAEILKATGELRQEVYRLAQAEVDRLNQLLPTDSIPWRVARIDFAERDIEREEAHRPLTSLARAAPAPPEDADFPANVRVEVMAKVTLRRLGLPLSPATFFGQGKGAEF